MRLRDKTVLKKICSEIEVATEILGTLKLEELKKILEADTE